MQLPHHLRQRIAELAAQAPAADLARAYAELSRAYRSGEFSSARLSSPAHRLAYLQVRLPATYAAAHHAFRRIVELLPQLAPASLLDLGSGPGTGMLAAREVWPSVGRFIALERDMQLIEMGRKLCSGLLNADFHQQDLVTASLPGSDIVVISYALGEITPTEASSLLERSWDAAAQLLIIIEPGTQRGFKNVLTARDALIAAGGHMVAPCPSAAECPMSHRNDWCHFAERIERTAEHRRIKGGELGHEDEKFSYVAFSKRPVTPARARIVRHPLFGKGHVNLELCLAPDIQQRTVSKRQKDAYRAARKSHWGGAWDF